MFNRRNFMRAGAASALLAQRPDLAGAQGRSAPPSKKGVLLMNRIGPSTSELYIANADGANERKLLQNSVFEYNASFSADGKSVVFTSERNGLGNSDVFRARIDGTGSSRS